MIRVAVIDSGLNPDHPHIVSVAGGATVGLDGSVEEGAFLDRLGHGTAVTAAIQEKAPAAAYYAVKVFDRELRTSAHALRGALNWCLKSGMDIVNLSLGSTNPANADMFRHIAAKASAAGMLLVSARQAEGVDCYPGCLPGVFAVEADWDLPRDSYTFNHDATRGTITIRASGYPRPVPGVPPNRNLLGVSFGVANACGFIVQACHEAGPLGTGPDRASRICQILAARLP